MTQWHLKSESGELLAQETYRYDFKGRRLHKLSAVVGGSPSSRTVSYIDKSYEIRDDTTQKHLFLGNLRVARLETPISQALQQIKNFSLNPGWNQIFMPVTPNGTSIVGQLGASDHLISQLLAFNAQKQAHLAFAPNETALIYKTLNKINARDVLWVKADGQHTWQVQGTSTDQEKVSQPLKAGWSHVSLPLENTIKVDAFTHGTAIEKIWAYDAATNKWTYWQKNPTDKSVGDTLTQLNPNQIYWVYTKRDQVIAQANGINSARYFLHNNHLGSVEVETGLNGSVHQASLYQPYGANGKASANTNRVSTYSFSAKEQDGSGLYYFEARYYDPLTTRFISPDPLFATEIEKCVDSIIECNLYQYTGNNPVNFVDLMGLEGLTVMTSGTASAGAGLGAAGNLGFWFAAGVDSKGITLAYGTFESVEAGSHTGASAAAGVELTVMLSEDYTKTTDGMFMAVGGSGGEGLAIGGDLVTTLPSKGQDPILGASLNLSLGGGTPAEAHVRKRTFLWQDYQGYVFPVVRIMLSSEVIIGNLVFMMKRITKLTSRF